MISTRIFEEFRKFISRGNVIDLAAAFIMGGAFTNIVNSIVKDIITPILGICLGGINFSDLAITLGQAHIKYGSFIQASINFLIISSIVFALVYTINSLQETLTGHKVEKPVSDEVKVLREIQDLLKQNLQTKV